MTESARSAASRALDVVRRAKAPTGGEVGGEGKREAEIYTPPRAHGTDFSGFLADFCRLKNSLKIHLLQKNPKSSRNRSLRAPGLPRAAFLQFRHQFWVILGAIFH